MGVKQALLLGFCGYIAQHFVDKKKITLDFIPGAFFSFVVLFYLHLHFELFNWAHENEFLSYVPIALFYLVVFRSVDWQTSITATIILALLLIRKLHVGAEEFDLFLSLGMAALESVFGYHLFCLLMAYCWTPLEQLIDMLAQFAENLIAKLIEKYKPELAPTFKEYENYINLFLKLTVNGIFILNVLINFLTA